MSDKEVSGIAFRDNLFDLFLKAEYAELFKYYLAEPCKSTKRSNLFLGVTGRKQCWKNEERKFSRFDKDGKEKDECLLIQLHKKLYPGLYVSNDAGASLPGEISAIEDESLVFFENMKFDCTYLPEKRKRLSEGNAYPIAWSYDWVIEVENIFEEFTHTLRSLLDVNCSKRIAIFFTDRVKLKTEFLKEINEKFRPAWELFFSSKYTRWMAETDLCLNVLIFPDTFESDKGIEYYLKDSRLVRWDQQKKTFIMELQYNF